MCGENDAPAATGAEVFLLTDITSGDAILANCDDVVRIVGVEIDYIVQIIKDDGVFENGRWRVEWSNWS